MTFQDAYDALLDHWGVPVDQLDLAGTHVNACGPADAPPVVLLAGHRATSPVWFAVAPRLAEQHRVYALDVPGDAGRSTATPPRTVDELMNWLSGVLKGIDNPALVGHSYGAWIALTYAIRNPGQVRKLALIDPTDCFTGLRLPYVARALPSLLRPSRKRTMSFLRWEIQGLRVDEQWLELAGLATEQPSTPVVRPKHPTDDQLRNLRPTPLVVVAGRSKSQNADKLTQRVTTLIPTATVVPIQEATHHSLPPLHADELSRELQRFLG